MAGQVAAGWTVTEGADDAVIAAALGRDRIWNALSLADLDLPFRHYSRFALAARPGALPAAVCLLIEHPAFTSLIPAGDTAGVGAILAAMPLPPTLQFLALPEHLPPLEQRHTLDRGAQRMLRMAVDAATFRAPAAPAPGVERLGMGDLQALLDLYTGYPGNFFDTEQLAQGVFYGVRAAEGSGALIAAGGTHVVAPQRGVASVGSIFTQPAARGRGLATAVTAAVTAALLRLGCRDVILNVVADNAPAIHVYRALGFRDHCRFLEGTAVRRPTAP